jgi:hypothetical protein
MLRRALIRRPPCLSSCLNSSLTILVVLHQHSYPLLTLAPSPTPKLTYPGPRTTPTTRPLSAGASPFSPAFGYSYRQRPSHAQYTHPTVISLASLPFIWHNQHAMNSLNILQGLTTTPPSTPPRSRTSSSANVNHRISPIEMPPSAFLWTRNRRC